MSRYRTWPVVKWTRSPFRDLDPLDRYLYLAIYQGPYSQALPGVSVCGIAALAEVTGLTDCRERIEVLAAQGVVLVDLSARLFFVPDAIDEAVPTNPNAVKAWRTAFDELADCDLRRVIDARVRCLLLAHGERNPAKAAKDEAASRFTWIRTWDQTFTEGSLMVPATFDERSSPGTGPGPGSRQDQDRERVAGSRKGEQEGDGGETIGGNLNRQRLRPADRWSRFQIPDAARKAVGGRQ